MPASLTRGPDRVRTKDWSRTRESSDLAVPSSYERAIEVTLDSLPLATVPVAATVLSLSNVERTLSAGSGGGVTFPFPSGLPTLWAYVSEPNGPIGIGGVRGGSLLPFVPLLVVGLLFTSALEAGFLGSLARRLDGAPVSFRAGVRRFTLRLVGVNLLRSVIVFAALPLLFLPPLALVVVVVLSYLVYGLPFEVVVRDAGVVDALESTVAHALDGGDYAAFGLVHLVIGAAASLALASFVRNTGVLGILVGALLVAVPAVFVATYGLLVFRELGAELPGASTR